MAGNFLGLATPHPGARPDAVQFQEMDPTGDKSEITQLLQAWRSGDDGALDRLAPLIYDDLRGLARRAISREPTGLTIQATALVNEVFLRLVEGAKVDWHDRSHFFAVAAKVMRRILTNAARARHRDKRGGGAEPAPFDEAEVAAGQNDRSLIALDDALDALSNFEPRKARMVEMRFFVGVTNDEIAEVLTISGDTVKRDWSFAKLRLAREIRGGWVFN
jgi:RNA polymerase sigma factor (TIGR02999 family)